MAFSAAKPLIRRHTELGIFLIGMVLIVLFATTSDGKWANLFNLATILQVTATLGLMSLGVALVIGTGEIDISAGSTFGMGALAYLWLAAQVDPSLAAIAAIAVGAIIGLVNGLLVTRTGTPSLIITLGTLMIFRGIAIALTEGFSFFIPYAARNGWTYVVLGGGDFLRFNTALYWLIAVTIILMVMLKAMPFGNRLLAVGGSAESAHFPRRSGRQDKTYRLYPLRHAGRLCRNAGGGQARLRRRLDGTPHGAASDRLLRARRLPPRRRTDLAHRRAHGRVRPVVDPVLPRRDGCPRSGLCEFSRP
jgi:ribose/xylose/arabinose/galactoside ABC-type transport system permease subunit